MTVPGRGPLHRRLAPALLAAILFVGAGALRGAEIWGKPLKGLSAVSVREVVAHPERFAGRDIRVVGTNAGAEGKPALKEDEAILPILTDGSFELPPKLAGAHLAAEGRPRRAGATVVFVASGVEVRR